MPVVGIGRGFEHRAHHQKVIKKFFSKSFENLSVFPIWWTLNSEKCHLVHWVLFYYGSEYGSNAFTENRRNLFLTFQAVKRKKSQEIMRFQYFLQLQRQDSNLRPPGYELWSRGKVLTFQCFLTPLSLFFRKIGGQSSIGGCCVQLLIFPYGSKYGSDKILQQQDGRERAWQFPLDFLAVHSATDGFPASVPTYCCHYCSVYVSFVNDRLSENPRVNIFGIANFASADI